MKKGTKAFTLVELIVVITILAILATIGFVSFSGYLAGSRDVNRVSQLKSMSDALELYRTKKDLPIPDDKVDIKIGTAPNEKTIAYQGYIGKNVLETIEYTESGLDPKYKQYFSYYLTKNKKYFQLMAFLEEENTDIVAINDIFNKTQAEDYSNRFPFVKGKKLGILLDINNSPIQEVSTITGSGYINISNTIDEYKAILSNDKIDNIQGTGSKLSLVNPNATCKRIKQIKGGSDDGKYLIDPNGNGIGIEMYCDMTTDGGGWTQLFKLKNGVKEYDFTKDYDLSNKIINSELLVKHPTGRYMKWVIEDKNYIWFQDRDDSYNESFEGVLYDGKTNVTKGILTIDGTLQPTKGVALSTNPSSFPFSYIARTNWAISETAFFWFGKNGPNELVVTTHPSYPTTLGYDTSVDLFVK